MRRSFERRIFLLYYVTFLFLLFQYLFKPEHLVAVLCGLYELHFCSGIVHKPAGALDALL